MQHADREAFIEKILVSLNKDLLPSTKKKIMDNPYEPYNKEVILDLMGKFFH